MLHALHPLLRRSRADVGAALSLLVGLATACGDGGQTVRPDIRVRKMDCTPDGGSGSACPSGKVCTAGGHCVDPCTSDEQCSAAERCDTESGLCIPRGLWPDAGPRTPNPCVQRGAMYRSTYRKRCLVAGESPSAQDEWVECRDDSDCSGIEGRSACHPQLHRCVPPWTDTPSFCSPCSMGGCPDGYTCLPQDDPPAGVAGARRDYCQPDTVVPSPDMTSCPNAGFQYLLREGTPACVPHRHCAIIEAGLAELPCEGDGDCVPPGWNPGGITPSLCPPPADDRPRVCRIPCSPSMGMGTICPPGWRCDRLGNYCERDDPTGGGGIGGGGSPPSL